MQKRMQRGLAVLIMTIMVAVTISGFVSASESTCDDSIDGCDSFLQNNGLNTETNFFKDDNDPDDRDECNNDQDDEDSEDCEKDNKDNRDDNGKDCGCNDERHHKDSNKGTAEIGDLVWDDLNANGIQDPDEPGIPEVTVNLWTGNQFKPITKIKTTTTNATGNYKFKNLKSGLYWLEFIAPNSVTKWIFSPLNQGTNDAVDSDANAAGIAGPTYLKRCESDLSWDAGLYRLAAVGDKVWLDVNKNGLQDPTEPGIAGVTVNLWTGDATGPLVKTAYSTITDINGNYIFANLVPGIYWLEFILPSTTSGFFTLQDQGLNDAIDSDVNASGIAGPIELISGEVDLTWDAGVDPGSAAGGEEEQPAAGGEELLAAAGGEGPTVAAAEVVALQETGVPVGMLAMAVLMLLAGLGISKRK